MKDEIKEIIDRLERIDHKEYIAFEFADSATFDEVARCFEERKKMADYITNLQEENERLNNIINKLEEQLNKGISMGICVFNKKSAKSLLSGAKYYQLFILDYLKELKEGK